MRSPNGMPLVLAPLAVAAVALSIACSSSEVGTGGAGGKDDKFHPTANGVATDEATACDTLHKALETRQLALSCTMTLRTCPEMVQAEVGTKCAQFDQGTINGCATYYGQAADCADLATRANKCAYKAIAGSAPKGCP